MARATPQVVNDRLVDPGSRESIVVGSPAWFDWLEQARLFAFRGAAGSFTARQETRAGGGAYWRAYRTIGGRQRRVYLGRSADLTPARLWAVAAELGGGQPARTPPTPLLATKLYVPRPRAGHVDRPELLARLAAGLRCPLTLIAAPAGWGKTTLLVQGLEAWGLGLAHDPQVARLEPQASRVAWLSLDASDNDPTVFLRYLIAALQQALDSTVGAMALALLDAPQPPPVSVVLTALINDLADARGPVALALDDYHVIDAPPVHQALAFLLDHLPPGLRLVLASREDPPLPLARLRGRGQLAELRAADLRFRPGEAATFLNDIMRLGLSAEAVAALNARTEGWVTGLQLAALAAQNHADRDRFVGDLSGSNRFIVDYLASEVLDQLPAGLRDFMLRTAILRRMCGPLCDAVLDAAGAPQPRRSARSALVLEQLERANLFVVPLDEDRHWYRYHQLFAEVLRERLARSLPAADIAGLHGRASAWFEQQQLIDEAIWHALAGRDNQRAAELIEQVATPMSLEGQGLTLAGWLARLPADLFEQRPGLALARAATASFSTNYAGAAADLDRAAAGLAVLDAEQADLMRRELAAQRALVASLRGDQHSIALGQTALAQLPAHHPLRGVVLASLSYAYFYRGNLAAADQILLEDQAAERIHDGQIVISASLVAILAMVRRAQGRLREVLRLSEQVVQRTSHGGRVMPLSGALLALLLLGLTQCEQNRLDQAEQTLRQCASLAAEYEVEAYVVLADFYLGQVLGARGDLAGAIELVERAAASGAEHLSPLNRCEVEGYRALLWLQHGDLASARDWAARREPPGEHDRPRFTAYDYDRFALAQLELAQARLDQAASAVARLLDDAEATGHGRFVIWALALQALVLQAQGNTAAALEPLARALALAEPEGYVRVFVDRGDPMAALLRALHDQLLARNDPIQVYARQLLAAFPAHAASERLPARPSTSDLQPLAEPLSQRELEVLRLLAQGHDNAQIAGALVIAVSTVKSHINHIFGKLGVGNRLEAVLRARQLELL